MHNNNNIKRLYAWMFFVTFTLMLCAKGIHFHYEHCHTHKDASAQKHHQASIKTSCEVCNFVFQKANVVKPTSYFATQKYTIIKLLSFKEQLVYHFILSIKANSPPLF